MRRTAQLKRGSQHGAPFFLRLLTPYSSPGLPLEKLGESGLRARRRIPVDQIFPARPIEELLGLNPGLLPLLCGRGGANLLDRGPELAPLAPVDGGPGLGLALMFLGGTGTGHDYLGVSVKN